MVLSFFTLDQQKHQKAGERYVSLVKSRYTDRLSEVLRPDERRIFKRIRPFHAGVIPYLLMDYAIQARGTPCQIVFANDLTDFHSTAHAASPSKNDILSIFPSVEPKADGSLSAQFRGFGPRIDLALNTISRLYLECLFTLTRVEAEVLDHLRTLQYEKYGDPTQSRTFGLQKVVAERLSKTPVAIHKSLKSAHFDMISETAKAMQSIIG